jgi:hypothetical protein
MVFDFRHGRRFRGVLIEARFLALGGVFGHWELGAGKPSWTGKRFGFKPHFARRATGLLYVGNRGVDGRFQRFRPGDQTRMDAAWLHVPIIPSS